MEGTGKAENGGLQGGEGWLASTKEKPPERGGLVEGSWTARSGRAPSGA